MNDLSKAFSFLFKDRDWASKCIVSAVFMILSLMIIGIPFLVGYFVQVTQRVMRGETEPLPSWSDFGVQFILGLKFCIVYFLYLLPLIILYAGLIVSMIVGGIVDESETLLAISALSLLGSTLVIAIPYGILLSLFSPIIWYRFAREESMRDALNIVQVFREFRLNWENALIVAVITLGVHSLASIGIIFFLIGIFFTLFYGYAITAYLAGLLYLSAREKGIAQ